MSKNELKDKILASREKLDSALGLIDDQKKSLVILHGEWSVKDLLGHLAYWENHVATLYEALKDGKSPEPVKDLDSLNSAALVDMQDKSLYQVKVIEQAAYQRVLEILEKASDPELFDPDHFPWTKGSSFQEQISDNTWDHYDEHLPELEAWLKRIA